MTSSPARLAAAATSGSCRAVVSPRRAAASGVLVAVVGLVGAGALVQIVRMNVRQIGLVGARTVACSSVCGRADGVPEDPAHRPMALLCLCPNTRCCRVPVVTQEHHACPTILRLGRLAVRRCGLSTLTFPFPLTRSRSLCRATGSRVLPSVPSPTRRMRRLTVATWCGLRTGGRATTVLTASCVRIGCRCQGGGC